MECYKISYLGIFTVALVAGLGFKCSGLLWDKIVVPRIERK